MDLTLSAVLVLVSSILLMVSVLGIARLIGWCREMASIIRETHTLLLKMESDRIDTKCSNLFAQVLRALEKEQVNISTYKRTSSTTMTIHRAEDYATLEL